MFRDWEVWETDSNNQATVIPKDIPKSTLGPENTSFHQGDRDNSVHQTESLVCGWCFMRACSVNGWKSRTIRSRHRLNGTNAQTTAPPAHVLSSASRQPYNKGYSVNYPIVNLNPIRTENTFLINISLVSLSFLIAIKLLFWDITGEGGVDVSR